MPDDLERLMDGWWPKFEAAAKEGLTKPEVGNFIPLEKLPTSQPWRINGWHWVEEPALAPGQGYSVSRPELKLDRAYEASGQVVFTVEDLRSSADELLKREVQEAAGRVSVGFLAWALRLAQTNVRRLRLGDYTVAGIKMAVAHSPWSWRLISRTPDPILTEVKESGIADTAVVPQPDLLGSALALLVPSQGGPRVSQLDVPAISWLGFGHEARVTIARVFLFTPGKARSVLFPQ